MLEVLVVFSIMAFLLALLVPSLSAARERVWRVMCTNNLRQWGAAQHYYTDDNDGYLPTEGDATKSGRCRLYTWYNVLPPYLDAPPYCEVERIEDAIKEFPALHIWICPSKHQTGAYKSHSGENQFHYGMNWVLDGLGTESNPSKDTPGFLDVPLHPIRAQLFGAEPHTVFMFDISPNSPGGTPRDVATMYQRNSDGRPVAKFHGDYANVLYLTGAVDHCRTDDLVTGRDFRRGQIIWDHPALYWGYPPR